MALAELERAYATGPSAESGWEATYSSLGVCGAALASTPLGLVRIWVTDPGAAVQWYQSFAARFPQMKAADPAIVIADGVLTLFFAVLDQGALLETQPGTAKGQGLWCGSDFSQAERFGPHVLGRPSAIRERGGVSNHPF